MQLSFRSRADGAVGVVLEGDPDRTLCIPCGDFEQWMLGEDVPETAGVAWMESPECADLLPPLDERTAARLRGYVAPVPLGVLLICTESPFGPLTACFRLAGEGCVIEFGEDLIVEAEVTAVLRLERLLLMLAGDSDLMATLEGGQVDGSLTHLMYIAGIVDDPAFQNCFEKADLRWLAAMVRALSHPRAREVAASQHAAPRGR